jgi:hypothetical protein
MFPVRRFGMLLGIVAGLMGSLIAAPAQAADLDLPTDAKIVKVLKAKRLMRCPQAGTRTRCGGARLLNPPLKDQVAISNNLDDGSDVFRHSIGFPCPRRRVSSIG